MFVSRRFWKDRIETKAFHDLSETYDIQLDGWDELATVEINARPDGWICIFCSDDFSMVIFLEWDEHRHEAEETHTEQIRMTKLIKYAKKNGYQGITFVRPNSAERKEIDRRQQDKFAELINKIKKDKQ